MIVVVDMKNIILQGETYHFCIAVPADCREEIGQSEIVKSLRTKKRLEAEKRAEPLREKWKAKFKKIRNATKGLDSQSATSGESETIEPSSDYLQHYHSLMEKNLPVLFDRASDQELCESGELYWKSASMLRKDQDLPALIPELELSFPLPSAGTQGENRKRKRALIKVLEEMFLAVDKELKGSSVQMSADIKKVLTRREIVANLKNDKIPAPQSKPKNQPKEEPERGTRAKRRNRPAENRRAYH